MTKLISMKIDAEELAAAEKAARSAGLSRNAYINQAVRLCNRAYQRKELARELRHASKAGRRETMQTLRDFENTLQDGLEGL